MKTAGEPPPGDQAPPPKQGIEKPPENSKLDTPGILELASAHWTTSVDGARRLRLKIRFKDAESGDGELMFDRNRVRFNDFGDQTSSTALAFEPHKIKLIRIAKDDPLGRGRRLYSVVGDGLPGRFTLVAPRGNEPILLVVAQDEPERHSVITLKPTRQHP